MSPIQLNAINLTKSLLSAVLLVVSFSTNAASLSGSNNLPLTLTGSNHVAGATSYNNNSTLTNDGTLENRATGFLYNNGTLTNNNTLTNKTNGFMDNDGNLTNKGTLNNHGSFDNTKDGRLVNNGELNNHNELDNRGNLSNSGAGARLNNIGVLHNRAGATFATGGAFSAETFNSGTINNDGLLSNFIGTVYSRHLNNNEKGTVTNRGLFFVSKAFVGPQSTVTNKGNFENHLFLENNGVFTNSGTFLAALVKFDAPFPLPFPAPYSDPKVESAVTGVGTYQQTAGKTTINSSMTQQSVTINGGLLDGSGIINSNVNVNGTSAGNLASVAPGNSIGTLTINGDYTQGEFGLLDIEFNETKIDLLAISGIASLAGILDFTFTGTDINIGTFNFLTFASVIGSFDSILLPSFEGFNFDVIFGDTFANLVVTSSVSEVPVPAALFLFGPALLGFLGLRRKVLKN